VTEAASAKVAKAPRVTLDDIKRRIIYHVYLQGTRDLLDKGYVPTSPFNVEPIKQAFTALGRGAVPVNALYIPGVKEPLVLPEILTVENLSEALGKLQK
jgi:hypothetical protein